ncbi:MAG: response regulator [Anaerolineae bacterium]|nr:response regulator [Anaerolineae bacterium]
MFPQSSVLIVDDEEVIRDFCEAVVEHEGLTAETAPNGQIALDKLARRQFDLILLDISMPVMNGLTVLEHLAAKYNQVSPIMMTGYATLESAIRAQDLGAEGFILKPFDNKRLVRVINQVLERRRLRQDYARLQAHLPLIALSHRLVTEQSLEALAEAALKIAREETGAADAALWLIPAPASSLHWEDDWPDTSPTRLASIGRPASPPTSGDWPDSEGTTWLAFDEHNGQVSDINQAVILHLTLQTEGHQVGVLSLGNPGRGRYFTNKDLDFLTVMSSYLAVGLENRYLYEAINLARQEWKTIFNTLNDGLLAHRAGDGVITRANQAMAAWLDTTVEALVNQSISQIPIDGQGRTLCDLNCPDEAAEPGNGQLWGSAEFASPPWAPGKSFRIRSFPLYKRHSTTDQSKELAEVIHVLEDITLANKMQSQLLQTEKLSALGRLLASLAHEINNPLQALRSGLRLLARPNLTDEKRQQYVATLDKEVERLIQTTVQTLDFARPSRIGKKSTDLNQLLQETLVLVNKQLQRHKITPSLELMHDLPGIYVVPDQVKQVFLNLILNAIDAMPDGGKLKLSTHYLPADNQVVAALADSGRGIPSEILNRIYEPFFSTKEAGSGLGLSISYSIVEAHGGHIEVESQPGTGSKFRVYLPVNLERDDATS